MGISFFRCLAWMGPLLLAASAASAAEVPASPDALIERASARRLWENRQWLYLGHYKKGWFGGWESQADGREFFLAPNGKSDPREELLTTLREFFRRPTAEELAPPKALTSAEIEERLERVRAAAAGLGREETEARVESAKRELLPPLPPQHPICRFPARLRFFERELDWKGEGLPKVECYRLDEFRRRLDAKSASLVFSSFYLGNPSSTFGHSFLRIDSGLWSQYGNYRNELLDTGINYAANPTTSNPVLYALFGIVGWFPGTFTAVPYYYKVREYNDFESRDLWSYDLRLTPEELAMLVDHIWEEGSTYYDYFYFTENCSYHMFTLIDAAAPRLELEERLAYYVIPSDTIRVLYGVPGLVSNVSYRPSILSQFRRRLSQFTEAERAGFDRAISAADPDAVAGFPAESQARILDAYSDQVELTKADDLLKDGSEAQKLKQRILVRRASLGIKSTPLEVPAPERSAPHLSHGMRRVSLGMASRDGHGLSETLGYKFAMNELVDPGLGYPRDTQIDFGQIRLRYRNEKARADARLKDRIEIDEIGIFKIEALPAYSRYYPSKSVRAELGWRKAIDRDCEDPEHRCLPLGAEYATGLSWDPSGKESLSLFALLQGRFEYAPGFVGPNIRAGAGPRVGAMVFFSDTLRFLLESQVAWRARARNHRVYSTDATLRWGFASGWAVDVSAHRSLDWSEAAAHVHFYY